MNLKSPVAIAVSALFATIVIIAGLESNQEIPELKKQSHKSVTVFHAIPEPFLPELQLTGTAQAKWLSEIRSQVSGRVQSLDADLIPGKLVSEGTRLVQLDPLHLEADVAAAFSDLKDAELNFQSEKREQSTAIKMLNVNNSSAFARREPQVEAAKAHVARAKKHYQSAKKRLSDAKVIAPFSAIIIEKHVRPNQLIERGDLLYTVAASDSLDVVVPVSSIQWQTLHQTLDKSEIRIIDRLGESWPARVRYVVPQVDPLTRQRQIVLTVPAPYKQERSLYAGQQVQVGIKLERMNNVMKLPMSSVTPDGQVWTLNKENVLRAENVSILKETQNFSWVQFEKMPDQSRQVVVFPLKSFIQGQEVIPESKNMAYQSKAARADL